VDSQLTPLLSPSNLSSTPEVWLYFSPSSIKLSIVLCFPLVAFGTRVLTDRNEPWFLRILIEPNRWQAHKSIILGRNRH
jgi:hypothetical protein